DSGGDRLARRGLEQGARRERPVRLAAVRQVKAPQVPLQVAGVHVVGDVITVQVDGGGEGDAIGARGTAGMGAQVVDRRRVCGRVDGHDEDTRIARSTAEAVAEDHRPPAIVQAAYLRGPIGVAEIAAAARQVGASDAGGGPLADHEARGVGFGEVAGGRVGDIQRQDRGTTRAQTANHPRLPRVTVAQVAGAGHGIYDEGVPVLRVRVVNVGGRRVNRLYDRARHVRQHFQAVVAGGDEVAVRIVGAGAEPVQQPVVPADIHHVHAGLRGGNVLGVGLRAETRLRIGGRGIQAVAPGPRIGRHRRTHPDRARVDDVAQYVRARAEQTGAGGVDFVAALAAQVVQTIGAVGRGVPRIDGRLLATARTGGQVAPLERNPRTAVPRQDDP